MKKQHKVKIKLYVCQEENLSVYNTAEEKH